MIAVAVALCMFIRVAHKTTVRVLSGILVYVYRVYESSRQLSFVF